MLRHASESDLRILDAQRSAQLRFLGRLPAGQQPPWHDRAQLSQVRAQLAELPPLVDPRQVLVLRQLLSRVEAGAALLLQVGECAETFAMASGSHVNRRIGLYRRLAERLAERTGRAVVLVARMAGQHAKPRSEPVEVLPDGAAIPTYRGDAVNRLAPYDHDARRADPQRLLASYARARDTLEHLQGQLHLGHPVFVSHEALLRDYEEAMTRWDNDPPPGGHASNAHYLWAQLYAASAHLLWIGERTRQLDNWHVQWATAIGNPIGLKIGPRATGQELGSLVRALNPRRERGRLSLILRLGAADAGPRLHALAPAVRGLRAPVLWQCDPMHGNTRRFGRDKLRLLPDIRTEISAFVRTLRTAGCHPGGLHLEVSPDDVRECHEGPPAVPGHEPRPPCDPRLNPTQAMEIVDHFASEVNR